MILRLLLYLVPLFRMSLQDQKGCNTRVDILDGAHLVEAVAIYLTDTTTAKNAAQCATHCHRKKCDVAYFNRRTQKCQFTSDTSSSAPLPCKDVYAVQMKEGIAELDQVQRFCMQCGSNKINGGSSIDKRHPLKYVHSARGEGQAKTFRLVDNDSQRYFPRRPNDIVRQKKRKTESRRAKFIRPVNRQATTYLPKERNLSRHLTMKYGTTANQISSEKRGSSFPPSWKNGLLGRFDATKKRHFGQGFRRTRIVSGQSRRKSFYPNHDHDRRTRLQSLGNLNTALYFKKKRKGSGNAK
uniref:Apple domain-containing protein n=1 Tax=Haemonchus contortus TaxID=6289 RepID=A0A7I4Y3E2_HAECO